MKLTLVTDDRLNLEPPERFRLALQVALRSFRAAGLRTRQGDVRLTQRQLSLAANLRSSGRYGRIEGSDGDPTATELFGIAAAYGVPLSEVIIVAENISGDDTVLRRHLRRRKRMTGDPPRAARPIP